MVTIANNTAANFANFFLSTNAANQSDSLARISSGSRIVSAADDAGGLGVSDQLEADITALEVASRTTQQVSALLQIADGGLARATDILQRAQALAVQFNSGTLDATSQGFLNDEFTQLVNELDLISTSTQFNGQNLLDGTTFSQTIVVGANTADTIDVDLTATGADASVAATDLLGALAGAGLGGAGDIDTIAGAIGDVSSARSEIGGLISAFEFQGEVIDTAIVNLTNANSTIRDVDIAQEQTNFTNFQVLTQASISALSQANALNSSLLSLLS